MIGGSLTRLVELPRMKPVQEGKREPDLRLKAALLNATVEVRVGDDKKNGQLRCSGLARLCPRAVWLRQEHKVEYGDELVDNDSLWTFDTGHAYHHLMQNLILPRLGDVYCGHWACLGCGLVVIGPDGGHPARWCPQPKECLRCHASEFRYVELEIFDAQYNLVGHVDGVLVWPDGRVEVLDVKTIRKEMLGSVDPTIGGELQEKYCFQVLAYMRLLGLRHGRVLYVAKDDTSKMAQSIAEQPIEIDDPKYAELMVLLDAVKAVRDGGPIPKRHETCTMKSKGWARGCEMRHQCFGAA